MLSIMCGCPAPHLDWLQIALLLVCLFDAGFFIYYLSAFSALEQKTISDTLFEHNEYRIVLTVLLAFRLTGATLFLARFRFKSPEMEFAGFAGIISALIGWAVLIMHHDNVGHFSGVGVFCAGSFLYSIALVRLAATNPNDKAELERVRTVLESFLILAVVVLVIAFVALWMEEQDAAEAHDAHVRQAYIVEHCAYLAHLVFYIVFFLYHSPDPTRSPKAYHHSQYYFEESGMEMDEESSSGPGDSNHNTNKQGGGVPMQCRPLIFNPKERLPVILEVVANNH